HLGIKSRSVFSRTEAAVLRIEIEFRVCKRCRHFLWRFARPAARNQEQLRRRLLRERQQQLLHRRAHLRGREIAADTYNSERLRRFFIVAKDQTLADFLAGLSIRKESIGKRLRDDGDEFRARSILGGETAATQ